MTIIASQPFFEMERKITHNEQYTFETKHFLHLYPNKIKASSEEFLLENITDISYRLLSAEFWLLYLHTNRGLFPYKTKQNPRSFIKHVQSLRRTHSK